MNYGFVRVAAAVPAVRVANCGWNAEGILQLIKKAEEDNVQIIVFPELSITAYTCGDLFHQWTLIKAAEDQLSEILAKTSGTGVAAVIGLPFFADNQLFNCAAVIQNGKLLGMVPKTYVPGYSEFYEERWFASGVKAVSDHVSACGQRVPFGTDLLFEASNAAKVCFGIEICEDLWVPIPPSCYQAVSGATILLNPSASNEVVGKYEYRRELVKQQSGRCIAGYVYTSAGVGESTTDVVYGGHALVAEYGSVLSESQRFSEKGQLICSEIDVEKLANDRLKNTSFMEAPAERRFRKIAFTLRPIELSAVGRRFDPHPFVPSNAAVRDTRCQEIFDIQTAGLAKRMRHTGIKHAVIAISGGLDSTLALLVTAKTFDLMGMPRENIRAITMPGFGTTNETYTNALQLMRSMRVNVSEIDIKPSCLQHFKDIGHAPEIYDITYENVQARERFQILFDIANKINGLVIGTGDLSELALGWCTYNGDHMSNYSVNCSIPKTLVKYLVQWVADNRVEVSTGDVLHRILDTPISPELLPPDAKGRIAQKTEDIIGPYELHDFFLYHMLRYGAHPQKVLYMAQRAFADSYTRDEIIKWLRVFIRRFFSQQFKRSCLPDGPKVGTVSLSPRGDWRMPSDADAAIWLQELE